MLTAAVSCRAATNRPPRSTIAFVTMKLPLPRRPKASVTPRSTRAAPTDSATFIGPRVVLGRSRSETITALGRRSRWDTWRRGGGPAVVKMDDVARLAEALAGVRLAAPQG